MTHLRLGVFFNRCYFVIIIIFSLNIDAHPINLNHPWQPAPARLEDCFKFSDGVIWDYVCDFDHIEIPARIGSMVVRSIGEKAFYKKLLLSVKIPDSVESIGAKAFAGNLLSSIKLPSRISSLGDFAFIYNQLSILNLPESLTQVGAYAFAYNELTNIKFPAQLNTIGDFAFAGNQLSSVQLPNSLSLLGAAAFAVNLLSLIEIPENVNSIGSHAFAKNKLTQVRFMGLAKVAGDSFEDNDITTIFFNTNAIRMDLNSIADFFYLPAGQRLQVGTYQYDDHEQAWHWIEN